MTGVEAAISDKTIFVILGSVASISLDNGSVSLMPNDARYHYWLRRDIESKYLGSAQDASIFTPSGEGFPRNTLEDVGYTLHRFCGTPIQNVLEIALSKIQTETNIHNRAHKSDS